MTRFDVLGPDDLPEVEAFLLRHAASSMFLRANLRTGGIVDEGKPYQATYAGGRDGRGELVAIAAVCWNGKMVLQAPVETEGVVAAAAGAAPRPIDGLIGPWPQVVAARRSLGWTDRRAALDSREGLFSLDLDRLVVPRALADGAVLFRAATEADRELLAIWRRDYRVEALHDRPGPELDATAAAEFDEARAAGRIFVLTDGGEPVATTAFNALLPEMVQVGGVFTPPALRGKGYARCAVAGSLLAARARGARQAILFTDDRNVGAQRSYVSLGFERVGDYGLVLF